VRIPRCVKDLQVRWESWLFDFSTARLFHGHGLLFGERRQELSLRAVVSDTVSSDGEGKCCVQVLIDDHLAAGHGAAPFGGFDLHDQVVKTYGVVPVNCALEPLREDQVQVPARAGQKRRTSLRCGHLKLAVELGHILAREERVGCFESSDPAQS